MSPSKKRLIVVLFSAITLGSGFAARYLGGRAKAARAVEDVLPEFKDVPPGPRAPASKGLGVVVGKSTLAEIEASIAARALTCRDTSARALMRAARENKARENKAQENKAQEVDATTKASAKGTSPMEKNPQVRMSCEGTRAEQIADRARPAAVGRLLYVFDSAKHPLRHVSYRRVHHDHEAARADVLDAIAAMKSLYGEPAATSGVLPAEGAEFGKYEPYKVEWSWVDVRVSVTALSYGERGVDVYEAVEVPWPVRSDAF